MIKISTDNLVIPSKISDRIYLLDTSLRDGEQTPGVSYTVENKIKIARQLDMLGIDVIEAGFPITSEGELESVKKIAKENLSAEICGLAMCNKKSIDLALDCDVDRIHVFIATSNLHLEQKLKMTKEDALKQAVEQVEYAKSHGVKIEFSAEDATRSDLDFVIKIFQAVEDAGADVLDIADTVGVLTPSSMHVLANKIVSSVKIPVSVHCHNDFGLAVANSLAAIEVGAKQIHVVVNGMGERAGNASLESVAMGLKHLLKTNTGIKLDKLMETSSLLQNLSGIYMPPNTPIIGENAFAHESGIHVHGMLSNPATYEPIDPTEINIDRKYVVGKHSGTHSIKNKLNQLGFTYTEAQLKTIIYKVKLLGDQSQKISDEKLKSIVNETINQ